MHYHKMAGKLGVRGRKPHRKSNARNMAESRRKNIVDNASKETIVHQIVGVWCSVVWVGWIFMCGRLLMYDDVLSWWRRTVVLVFISFVCTVLLKEYIIYIIYYYYCISLFIPT